MTGRRHRSNCELVAQGVANIGRGDRSAASASPAPSRAPRPTCAPARAARSPACCMRSSCCCSCWWPRRSPPTSRSPASARVLAVVAWNMAEKQEFARAAARLARRRRGAAGDLPADHLRRSHEGIVVGVALGAFLFLHRMAEAVEVEGGATLIAGRCRRRQQRARTAYDPKRHRRRRRGLSHRGRILLRRRRGRQHRARPHRRAPKVVRARLLPRCRWSTAPPPRRSKASCTSCGTPGTRRLFRRRAAERAPHPADRPGCASRWCAMPPPPRMRSPIGGRSRRRSRERRRDFNEGCAASLFAN